MLFEDGANYSLTDLYPECEKEIRELIDAGRAFPVVTITCRKEPEELQISCDGEAYFVSIWKGMDDLADLIDTASYFHGVLTNEEIDDILSTLDKCSVVQEEARGFMLPVSASLDEILDRINMEASILDNKQEAVYNTIEGMVIYVVEHR